MDHRLLCLIALFLFACKPTPLSEEKLVEFEVNCQNVYDLYRWAGMANPAIPELIKKLEDNERCFGPSLDGEYKGEWAAKILVEIGSPAVPELKKALNHPQERVRARAKNALDLIKQGKKSPW